MLMPEKLYTTGEVAKIFGVSYVAVKKWVYSGKIKCNLGQDRDAIAVKNLLRRQQMDVGAS